MTTDERDFMRALRRFLREWDVTVTKDEEGFWYMEDSAGDIQLQLETIQDELTP